LDLGFLPGFFGFCGFFAIAGIWDASAMQERANAPGSAAVFQRISDNAVVSRWQHRAAA
jgi:hypothetical protein